MAKIDLLVQKVVKLIYCFMAGILVGAVIVGATCTYFWRVKYVGEFDVDHYTDEIMRFPGDDVLGPVNSKREAQEKALIVFKKMGDGKVRLTQRPLGVSYDGENGMWLVSSHLRPGSIGGNEYAIIRASDGKVIARWGYK